jgi:hypothetical protein
VVTEARNLSAGGFARLQQRQFRRDVDFNAVDEDFRHRKVRFRAREWTIYCVAASGRKVRYDKRLDASRSHDQFWRFMARPNLVRLRTDLTVTT